ncbi:hypothetical protein MTP99_000839 [Tenebrio molitor]|nr:hypothetical protein MTP99_000839 [Tenebrio molitor]
MKAARSSVFLLLCVMVNVLCYPLEEYHATDGLEVNIRSKRGEKMCHILNRSHKPITESHCELVCWEQEFRRGECIGSACYCS